MEFKNRVRQLTNTIGTDNYSIGDSVSSFQTFAHAFTDGDETLVCCTDGVDYEIAEVTVSNSGLLLTRDTVVESTNGNAKVVWSTGNKNIFVVIDSETINDITSIDINSFATLDDAIAMSIALG